MLPTLPAGLHFSECVLPFDPGRLEDTDWESSVRQLARALKPDEEAPLGTGR